MTKRIFEMTRGMIMMTVMALSAAAAIAPASAMAQDRGGWEHSGYQDQRYDRHDEQGRWSGGEDRRDDRDYDRRGEFSQDRGYHAHDNRGYDNRGYDNQGYYRSYNRGYEDRSYYPQSGYGSGYQGRPRVTYRCHNDGSTGAIIGARPASAPPPAPSKVPRVQSP